MQILLTTDGKLKMDKTYMDITARHGNFTANMIYSEQTSGFYFIFPSVNHEPKNEVVTNHISLRYDNSWSELFDYQVKIGSSSMRSVIRWDLIHDNFYAYDTAESSAYYLELDGFYSIGNDIDLAFGYSYRKTDKFLIVWDYPELLPYLQNAEIEFSPGEEQVVDSFYSQIEWAPSNNVKLILGARWERENTYEVVVVSAQNTEDEVIRSIGNEDSSVDIIPRAAAIYSLSAQHSVKLLYGEALNRPGLFQRIDSSRTSTIPLKNEEIKTFEFIYSGMLTDAFSVTTSLFRNELDNLTAREFPTEGVDTTSIVSSSGEVETNGVELGVIAQLTEALRVDISLTQQKTKDLRTGFSNIDFAYSPEKLAYLAAFYQFNEEISLSVSARYIDKMEALWVGNAETGGRLSGNPGSDSYTVVNLGCSWQRYMGDDSLRMGLSVHNLFDKEYRFATVTLNDWADNGFAGEERRFDLTFEYSF